MRVLLVDDSPVMRRFVARTLKMTGIECTIDEAGNGREAIAKAKRLRPDLIISDLYMPEMTGGELVAEVSRDPNLTGTPVLILSSDRSVDRPLELMQSGASAYLTKPVSPEVLRDSLIGILERRR